MSSSPLNTMAARRGSQSQGLSRGRGRGQGQGQGRGQGQGQDQGQDQDQGLGQARQDIPPERIRNFCIIAHVDHGKSTLADRLLQLTGLLPPGNAAGDHAGTPSLDSLPVERARGITVKTQTASMVHSGHLLNLMDTPGHLDFGYEVSRALAACQGAVLLVDARAGIQPQTVANWRGASRAGLDVIPVVNKIDLHDVDVEGVVQGLADLTGTRRDRVLRVSARTGLYCDAVLSAVIERVRPPPVKPGDQGTCGPPLQALVVDSWLDDYRGVVCQVALLAGTLSRGDQLALLSRPDLCFVAHEVGHLTPKLAKCSVLAAGHVGYVVTGLKNPRDIRVGDALCWRAEAVSGRSETAVPVLVPAQPTVFAGLFPLDSRDLATLGRALEALLLNDPSVQCDTSHSPLLGVGWRLGFLGTLHLDVFRERLAQEKTSAPFLVTPPSVVFRVIRRDGSEQPVSSPDQFPELSGLAQVVRIEEPLIRAVVGTDAALVGPVLELVGEHRGRQSNIEYLEECRPSGPRANRAIVTADLPLMEVISDFHDRLQSRCSGDVSFHYEHAGYVPGDIVKIRILVNSEPIAVLSGLQHASRAAGWARAWLERLRDVLDRQQFDLVLQAAIGTRVIARETVRALRKDVTAKCYGGDASRQKKLLEKQREGKEKLKRLGRVTIRADSLVQLFGRAT